MVRSFLTLLEHEHRLLHSGLQEMQEMLKLQRFIMSSETRKMTQTAALQVVGAWENKLQNSLAET